MPLIAPVVKKQWHDRIENLIWAAKDQFEGLDCFLCCPGPSLRDVDTETLHGPGRFVVAVNTAYPTVRRPDFWVGMDRAECYQRDLLSQPFPKIFGTKFVDDEIEGRRLADFPNVWFAGGVPGNPIDIFSRDDIADEFVWNDGTGQWPGHTFLMALHVIVWLGAKTIYLVGNDFGGVRDYCDDRELPPDQKEHNARLYRQLVGMVEELAHYAKDKATGVELVSCTPVSPINEFLPTVSIEHAIGRAEAGVTRFQDTRVWSACDAELLRWGTVTNPGIGVVTMCDFAMEWLLPWWLTNFRKHNPRLPVAFADYGMSEEGLAFARKHGPVYAVNKPASPMWDRLPFVMLDSPFQQTVMMDADCEVKADLMPLFHMTENRLGLTIDPYNHWSREYFDPPFAAGMMVCTHGDPIVLDWARYLLRGWGKYRSCMEALNHCLADRKRSRVGMPVTIDRSWQWLRLDDRDGDGEAKIIHWTGPDGKKIILEAINGHCSTVSDIARLYGPDGKKLDEAPPAAIAAEGEDAGPAADGQCDSPLVSILTPAYNVEKYIADTIKSCQQQTYTNWELLIVDDGSTDKTLESAKVLGNEDSRIRLFVMEHGGIPVAFNRAVAEAKGEYLVRLDADDMMHPRRLERQVAEFATGADIVTCAARYMAYDGTLCSLVPCEPWDARRYLDSFDCGTGSAYSHPPMASIMAKREVFDAIGDRPALPDELMGAAEDWWCCQAIDRGYRWSHVPHPDYYYRRREDQMSTRPQGPVHALCKKYASEVTIPEPAEPLVSILMPAYNTEKYIGAAVQSCIDQTYKNWELVIVDDGSTDAGYAPWDARIRICRIEHAGFAVALNKAISEAKGDYFVRLDADDTMGPDRLVRQVAALKNADIVLCAGRYMAQDGTLLDTMPNEPWDVDLYLGSFTGCMENVYPHPPMGSIGARRSVFEAIGQAPVLVPHLGPAAEDWWACEAIKRGYTWGYVPTEEYFYRKHPAQYTQVASQRAVQAVCRQYANAVHGAPIPDNPFVSILMPAYNAEQYIRAAIESCQAQTHENWELIIVNDGGTDDTCEVVIDAAGDDARVRHYAIEHSGFTVALGEALLRAKGDVITRLDADDMMAPDRLAEQLKALQHADISTCAAMHMSMDGTETVPRKCEPMDPEKYVRCFRGGELYWHPPLASIMATRETFGQIGRCPPLEGAAQWTADDWWVCRAIEMGMTWTHVDAPLYLYRRDTAKSDKRPMAAIEAAAREHARRVILPSEHMEHLIDMAEQEGQA